jgi:two-component system KDP operon response regulator KdpE
MKILIVAGDGQIINDISFCLKVRYPDVRVLGAREERQAAIFADYESPDLIFIDSSVDLDDLDTVTLICRIRGVSDAPLIILSDNATDMDRARGLEAGADEYIPRSFSPIELLARCKALLRRARGEGFNREQTVTIDELTVNFTSHEVFLSGQQVKITPIEFGILSELVRNEGRLVTNHDLLDRVWGEEYARDSSLIKTYVYRLRSKLESSDAGHHLILNERGCGYRLLRG